MYYGNYEHGQLYYYISSEIDSSINTLIPLFQLCNQYIVLFNTQYKSVLPFELNSPLVSVTTCTNILKDLLILFGLIYLFNMTYCIYDWIRRMIPMGWSRFSKHIQDIIFKSC